MATPKGANRPSRPRFKANIPRFYVTANSWIDGFLDAAEPARELTRRTWMINDCDSEADCFALFDAQR